MSTRSYNKSVNKLSELKTSFTFDTKGDENGDVVFGSILSGAERSIKIYMKSLDGRVIKKFEDQLLDIIDGNGAYMKIMCDEVPVSSCIYDDIGCSITTVVKEAPEGVGQRLRDIWSKDIEVCISDSRAFQLRTGEGSTCDFNCPRVAESLEEFFDRHWEMAKVST